MLAPALPPLLSVRNTRNTADASTDRTTTLLKVGGIGAPAGSFLAVGDGVPSSENLASWRGFLIGGGPADGRRRGFLAMARGPSWWVDAEASRVALRAPVPGGTA